ncbi:MAG: TaqI-like C-terminal specificity domain-containing protein, partial [Deltaproteobacteria bacterium]
AIDSNNFYSDTTTYILGSDSKYLLGMLNSRLWTFLCSKTSSEIRGGFYRWKRQYVSQLPIRPIDFANRAEKAMHDKIVSLVDSMLTLNKKLKDAKTPHDKELLERQIKATDKEIDRLVYGLYGLTDDEIKMVEGTQ